MNMANVVGDAKTNVRGILRGGAILGAGVLMVFGAFVPSGGDAAEIWNGATIQVRQPEGVQGGAQDYQDRITEGLWLTRKDSQGLFNVRAESAFGEPGPTDTEWAFGTTDEIGALTFMTWSEWVQQKGGPSGVVGCRAVLHIVSADIFIDIRFTSWVSGGAARGGFSYERATALALASTTSDARSAK